MIIDLHLHSVASDGTDTPSEIIQLGWQEGEKRGKNVAVALTDHDSVAGIYEFLSEAEKYEGKVTAIAGIEFSTYYKEQSIHMLGYGIDYKNQKLLDRLQYFRDQRDSRNDIIIERLREAGIDITIEDIKQDDPEAATGRPLIAQYMMEKGYVSSIKEAFSKYIGKGKPCYVGREKPDIKEVIDLIHESGGLAVMAHPVNYDRVPREEIDNLIARLAEEGLDGLEVFYGKNKQADTDHYLALAREHGLLMTGGSDYHGDVKPDISMFTGRGEMNVAEEMVAPFLNKIEKL